MEISFETITERDMDLLLMRKFSIEDDPIRNLFLKEIGYENKELSVIDVAHSVSAEEGESDIEIILEDKGHRKYALLIEDKINAIAMKNQAGRYSIRGNKAVNRGTYDEFYVFIMAPEKYWKDNTEAQKYPHKISYESIQETLTDPFDIAVMNRALDISKRGYVTLYNRIVTEFWDKVYDFVDKNYPNTFRIHGERGLARSAAPGQWITINCNNQFRLQIKSDRGYVDLEINGYADKIKEFFQDNRDLIDEKKLYVRLASKSLAIRRYFECIDFSKPFEEQEVALKIAFDAAKDLQDLIKVLKIRNNA